MSGEQEHGPRLDEIGDDGTIRIPSEELRRLLNENARLNDQVRELHAANAALVEERRLMKLAAESPVDGSFRDGYRAAADEIAARIANDTAAKERGLFPDDQNARIEWDAGYDAACAAFRLGHDPRELLSTVGPEVSTSSDAAIVHGVLDGLFDARIRPDPRRPNTSRRNNSFDRAAMVREFFERVVPHQERLPSPGVPSDAAVRFQSSLLFEEFVELLESVFDDRSAVDQIRAILRWFLDMSPIRLKPSNLVDAADALVDVAYTAEGFLVACGIDGTALFRLVHESNLAKQNGPIVDRKRMKPAGWTPPDVAGELRWQSLAAGRKGPEDEGSDAGRVEGRPEVKSGVVCPLCRGKKTGTRVDAIEADGTFVNPRPAACIACDGSGEVEPDEEDSGDPRDTW